MTDNDNVFVFIGAYGSTAAAWEDYGQVQLEALADGALLVCAPGGGTFEALPIARELEPALVAANRAPEALAECVRRAFAMRLEHLGAYRETAAERLAGYRPEAVAQTVAERVLPALLGQPRPAAASAWSRSR